MLRAVPFLLFDGNCAEAMTFYHQCLGGELTITKLADTPMKDMFPAQKHSRVINANLTSDKIEISASDWMAAPQYEPHPGDTTAIFVIGEGYEELEATFKRLAEGAKKDKFQPLHELPFGMYGQFTDKFGVNWIFKSDKPAL
jgi:PhnB protein